jgi:hypothetical protein
MMPARHRDVPGFVRSLRLRYSVRFHAAILLAAGFAVRLVDPSADTIGEAVARLASH